MLEFIRWLVEDDKEGVMVYKVMIDSLGEFVVKDWRNFIFFLYIFFIICVFRYCELNWFIFNYVIGFGIIVEFSI